MGFDVDYPRNKGPLVQRVTPHSVGRCRAATEGFGHVSGVGRRLTEGPHRSLPVKPHIFPRVALCISPKVIQPLDTCCSDMLLYSHRRRIVDTRHIYHQKQKKSEKSCKNLLTNHISCGIIIKLSGERAQGTAQQDLEN